MADRLQRRRRRRKRARWLATYLDWIEYRKTRKRYVRKASILWNTKP